jgi:hypothetical protein
MIIKEIEMDLKEKHEKLQELDNKKKREQERARKKH